MKRDADHSRQALGRLFNYANNPLTIVGTVLTTVSGLSIVVYLVTNLAAGLHNPYANIIAFIILPGLFLLGLLLIPPGMWHRRRRLIAAGVTGDELAAYPRLDFNSPQVRRFTLVVLGLTAVNAVIFGSSSFLGVEYMDTASFCGRTCHTVMQPEYTAYQESPHSRVACVECHIGPGTSWFVRSKLDGLRQVWHTVMDTYPRPIETPVHNLRPARETCEHCHWPARHVGDKLKLFADFGTDEANTPSYTAMLLRTGGGTVALGRHGGIHWWHIYSDNRIRYVAKDPKRQEMVWVELVTRDGERRVYTRGAKDVPNAEQIQNEARIMDCIDCHNRPTHLFENPTTAVDELLVSRPDLVKLPYFKKQAVAAIESAYPTHAAGLAGVREAIAKLYQEQSPAPAADLVALGANAAAEIYGRTFFPEMKTDWRTHTFNIGHQDFPGCWRCHDDTMATADGKHVIPQDCDTCHEFIVQDSPTLPEVAKLIAAG